MSGGVKVALAIVTRGRSGVLAGLLRQLEAQTRTPDSVILSAEREADLEGAMETPLGAKAVTAFGAPGVAAQRNRALALAGEADVMLFLDDDFVPFDDAIAGVATLFATRPDLAAATGQVVADGVGGPPVTAEAALRLIAAPRPAMAERPVIGLYGCNMAVRMAATEGIAFDEGLPLYGWQEDLDFGARVARRGAVIRTPAFGGVHRGVKAGRLAERGLGYAQIANPARLLRRSPVPAGYLLKLMARNVAANLARAAAGDPWADRRGRLAGNLIALGDLLRGRLDPERARAL